MNANKPASPRSLKSDFSSVDKHVVNIMEYEELPELTNYMLARAKVSKGGRPVSLNPCKLISLRLPGELLEMWKVTELGCQTCMTERPVNMIRTVGFCYLND